MVFRPRRIAELLGEVPEVEAGQLDPILLPGQERALAVQQGQELLRPLHRVGGNDPLRPGLQGDGQAGAGPQDVDQHDPAVPWCGTPAPLPG